MVYKLPVFKCEYCGSLWKEDARGRCSYCGAPKKELKTEEHIIILSKDKDVETRVLIDHYHRTGNIIFFQTAMLLWDNDSRAMEESLNRI